MRARDPDDPTQGKAWAAGIGVALSIVSLGLLAWMALDVDNDGRSSYSEFQDGTSPMRGDTDGDGVADGWEWDHGYDALSAASVPQVEASVVEAEVDEARQCSIEDLLAGRCTGSDDGAQGGADDDGPSTSAEVPPEGGDGTVGSLALGGATTLVAGLGARLISSAITHK